MRKWCTQAWSVLLYGKIGPLSPGLCGCGLNSANPGVQLPGLKWDFFLLFFPRGGCRGAVPSLLLPLTIQLEGVGTVSLVVLMWFPKC